MMSVKPIDEFGSAYLRLALEIDKHIAGYVDAYYGPEIIKEDVTSTPALKPYQLLDAHMRLLETLPASDKNRQQYLKAILDAMRCSIGKIGGEEYEYLEEIRCLYGISPKMVEETRFLEARNALDTQLPGRGSPAERMKSMRDEQTIPPQEIPAAVEAILGEIQTRSGKLVPLVPRESVAIEYVRGKSYGADCHYLGNYQSLIRINLDRDWQPLGLTSLLSHEAYPGHHTEFQIKEECLYRERGYAEESCNLLFAPGSIIQEGIANTAFEIISPELELFEWMEGYLIPRLQLPTRKALELYHVNEALKTLKHSISNVAIQYNSGLISEDDAIEYLHTYGLYDPRLARQLFEMVKDPLYRTYMFTYTAGYDLIDKAVSGESKLPLFRRLLSEQMLPGDLQIAT
jgi:hypothetical protein